MPQLTIQTDPDIAFEGQIAYPMFPRHVFTHYVSQVGGIPFGSAVVRAAADDLVKLPGLSTDITNLFEGFAIRQEYLETNTGGYSNGASLPILRRGYIWVLTEGAVTAESAVFARYAAGTFSVLGKVRADADTATAVAIPNAKFLTSLTAAGYAIVEVK
jgi:hypothetical protein